jgi:cell wall assembly regulator SMI1
VEEIWQRIEKWLAANAPEVLQHVQPGTTEEQLLATEDILGVRFPEDMRASYLLHDGCSNTIGFIHGLDFLSLEAILFQWHVWKDLLDSDTFEGIDSEPDEGVRSDWWNARWIPLTYNDMGDHYCLDLDPAPGGTQGQIITMWHDMPERTLIAKSFEDWFRQFAEALEAGEYTTSEEYDGLVRINDL